MIADVAMAKRGSPRMGFSAAFGGPLFNMLLGIGLPFTIQILGTGGKNIGLEFDSMTAVLAIGLAVSLIFSYVLLPILRFKVELKPASLKLIFSGDKIVRGCSPSHIPGFPHHMHCD